MRLQHLTIIFIAIFLPILLITSYYIQQQVDTVNLETSYDAKLLDATHDAMSAFEINTANEDLSTVADSLRSIIEASNNIFFNTLATNMGVSNASKSYVQPYVPAILYTLYDGYYIYAPTNTPEVCTDKYGQTITTSDYGVQYINTITDENGKMIGRYKFNRGINYIEGTTTPSDSNVKIKMSDLPDDIQYEYGQLLYKNKDGTYSTVLHSKGDNKDTYYKQSYILKSFVSYSANYRGKSSDVGHEDDNININYTLDNFMTITGNIGGIYYTKSGYLIKCGDNGLINEIRVNNIVIDNWRTYSNDEFHNMIYDPEKYIVEVELNEVSGKKTVLTNRLNVDGTGYWEDAQSAVEYYIKAWTFSNWVYENLGWIKESNVKDNGYKVLDVTNTGDSVKDINLSTSLYSKMMYNFENDNDLIFGINKNPEDSESTFAIHKRNVIKNSITYNLVLAMVTYTEMSRTTEFSFPVMAEPEWDKILSNVSVVAYMQGLKCGLKTYNNYAIVTSINNEISVTPSEIYYTPIKKFGIQDSEGNEISTNIKDDNYLETAHRIDCPELEDTLYYVSFKSKEIKYDKIYNKSTGIYDYDHKLFTDYNCIVSSSYQVKDANNSSENRNGNSDILRYLQERAAKNDSNYKKRLRAYRIAVAKEKNNLYKSIEFRQNSGVKIWKISAFNSPDQNKKDISDKIGSCRIYDIKKIEIVIHGVENKTNGVYTDKIKLELNDSIYGENIISTTSKGYTTLVFDTNFSSSEILTKFAITNDIKRTQYYIDSIKFYYK